MVRPTSSKVAPRDSARVNCPRRCRTAVASSERLPRAPLRFEESRPSRFGLAPFVDVDRDAGRADDHTVVVALGLPAPFEPVHAPVRPDHPVVESPRHSGRHALVDGRDGRGRGRRRGSATHRSRTNRRTSPVRDRTVLRASYPSRPRCWRGPTATCPSRPRREPDGGAARRPLAAASSRARRSRCSRTRVNNVAPMTPSATITVRITWSSSRKLPFMAPSTIASPTANAPRAATCRVRAPNAAITGPTINAPVRTASPCVTRSAKVTIAIATSPARTQPREPSDSGCVIPAH